MKRLIAALFACLISCALVSSVQAGFLADGTADEDEPNEDIYSLERVDYLHLTDVKADGIDDETGQPKYIFHYSVSGELDAPGGQNLGTGKGYDHRYKILYHTKGDSVGNVMENTLYVNLPKLPEGDYECTGDNSSFSCNFSISGTVEEVKDISVVVRRWGWWEKPSNYFTLWYSTRTKLHEDCTIGVEDLDCKPGTQVCADRVPYGTAEASLDKFGNYYGSRKCIDAQLQAEDAEIDTGSHKSSDYSLVLTDGIGGSMSIKHIEVPCEENSEEICNVLLGGDIHTEYFYTITGPYGGSEDAGFENQFTVVIKNEGNGSDYDYSGSAGLKSTCTYNSGTVRCEFSYAMYKISIERHSIKIFNTRTMWLSPEKDLTNCTEDLVKPIEDYECIADRHEAYSDAPNAYETIVENVCVEEEDAGETMSFMIFYYEAVAFQPLDIPQEDSAQPSDPTPTADGDGDGIDDALDNCPSVANAAQGDADTDGLGDVCDNCPVVENPGQENFDGDLKGDVCDSDDDNDGLSEDDYTDPCPFDKDNTCSTVAVVDNETTTIIDDITEGYDVTDTVTSGSNAGGEGVISSGCSMIPRAAGGMGGFAIFLLAGLLGPLAITRIRRK